MKALKTLLILLGLVLLMVIAAGTYVKVALPNTGETPAITVSRDKERVENGRYLANHVAVCMDCHSTRDWSRFAGPMMQKDIGAGGEAFDRKMGFPGEFYAPNITPYALGEWSDGELFHAITTGVSRDGRALFPIMAAHRFGRMDKEDIYDIIAYIRTLAPVKKDVPASKADFPVNIIINTMPEKADFQSRPARADIVRYGGYLVNAAGCVDCHSQTDKGSVIEGTEFGGGMEFRQPAGIVRSANITSENVTGIGNWSKAQFVSRFKAFADSAHSSPKLAKGSMNTPMPWSMYAGMSTGDLEAIYAYLRSVKKIRNRVVRFSAVQ
ncbi:c-type cytochrome [Pedobacter deserti]|uniref:c-type cytochrome n=1 Tax=Pedobacter deserti TaxID=2817382 RepID=UPI00210B8A74|nr:c-type cytochrome [Pedobacter sp. SYSU D00382]